MAHARARGGAVAVGRLQLIALGGRWLVGVVGRGLRDCFPEKRRMTREDPQ